MKAQTRVNVLIRDQYRCVMCGTDITHRRFSVHHRKYLSQGGTDDEWNLIVLCGSGTEGCHHIVHSMRDDFGIPGGYIVPSWDDPRTIPVHYHSRGPVLLSHDSGTTTEGVTA